MVQIFLPPSLQPLVENLKHINVSGRTLGECLDNMVRQYRPLENAVFDKRHCLQKGLSLYLNGETFNDVSMPIQDGDKLYIINILVGG